MSDNDDQDIKRDLPAEIVLPGHAEQGLGFRTGGLVLADQVLPPDLLVLPIATSVIYPSLMVPLIVSEPQSIATVEAALKKQKLLGLVLTKTEEVKEPNKFSDLYEMGVVVKVLKRLKLPDGSINILVHSIKRFKIDRKLTEKPSLVAQVTYLKDELGKNTDAKKKELDALTRTVISNVKRLSEINPFFTEEMKLALINAPGPGTVADLVAFALSLPREEAQEFLETISVGERFEKLLVHLKREQDVADIQRKIQDEVNTKINTMQREYFLKEQLKAIKKELGMEEDGKEKSSRTFRERIEEAGMPDKVKEAALEEVEKFETLSEQSPEYNVSRSYLELLCTLPWALTTEDNLDLRNAQAVLDEDHYGLEEVKKRITQFLAVRSLQKTRPQLMEGTHKGKGSIICLVGPPGVGKTSIGKSVARTLGREFYRFSLGGMRDEAEIKGHRRTYIGAMPGKIIQAIKRAGTKNPVLMLDEIDKLGQSFQGDPASALLEVLDPEQNVNFIDHYLDQPFDLSEVLFIATANSKSSIPGPLLDRMEVIEIPGYTVEEKQKIAEKYVIPRVLRENGLLSSELKFTRDALRQILHDYAREPGLRNLQNLVGKVARQVATELLRSRGRKKTVKVTTKGLSKRLGPKVYYNEVAERIVSPGVVIGLAWTASGGDILFIEATDIPGTGQLKLTGQMGEVMTESASIAWSYVKRKLAQEQGLVHDDFAKKDLHLHIPAGAIPKDGPSAGITMATALYSLHTGRKFRHKLAMTGELSLAGKVLPVGGIKEKILAAKRAGITQLILPKLNEKDLEQVPEYALKGMTISWASHIEEVFDLALTGGVSASKPKKKSQLKKKRPSRRKASKSNAPRAMH